MKRHAVTSTRGSAVVALMLTAVIILGSIVMLNAAAVVTIGGTSRALEIARQNAVASARLEKATREAAQVVFGAPAANPQHNFENELKALVQAVPLGAITLNKMEVSNLPTVPRSFPDLAGPPSPLAGRSSDLELLSTPNLQSYVGARVAESLSFQVNFTFGRKAVADNYAYSVVVTCRLVAVPISRHAVMAYDLPNEIGMSSSATTWPVSVPATSVGPRGLVPDRDPAGVSTFSSYQKRPEHFRYAAALSETYGYIFSQGYLQNAVDCAGITHFVQIGAGTANPVLAGGNEAGKTYTLDLGTFGNGTLGLRTATKNLAVLTAISPGCSLILTDSGSETTPILLVIAGPADTSMAPLSLTIASSLQRPVVLVCYHASIETSAAVTVNGALVLDRDCVVSAGAGPLTVGHLSYWGGGPISTDAFRLGAMPETAENLMPRVVYVASSRNLL